VLGKWGPSVKTKGMNTEIKTAAELIRFAFAWSYAEDGAEEAALEQKLKTMIADLDPEERDRLGWRFAMLAQMCRR
jgi:hypothetical protein